MTSLKQILHIDMNAFYASCHQAQDPQYRGKPIAVAGSQETRHGVVVTASYEARSRGVKATMTVPQALRVCPDLILIRPDFSLYRYYARKVFNIVERFTPIVEVASIDECYADVTGSRQFGDAKAIAKTLQQTIREELLLPCSIGVADCKFFSKMGSNLKKPMGITVISQKNFKQVLWPLDVGEMHGVGEKTAEKLRNLKVYTIGSLATTSDALLRKTLGVRGVELKQYANGMDLRAVSDKREPAKSVGHSVTLPKDEVDMEAMLRVLLNLSDQVGRRLRRNQQFASALVLTIRYSNRETITRRTTLMYATDLTEHIYRHAKELLTANWQNRRPVRLIGVAVTDLLPIDAIGTHSVVQTELFDDGHQAVNFQTDEKLEKLTRVTDQLRNRFGEDIVVRGRMLQPDSSNALRDHKSRGTSLQKDQLFDGE